MCCKSQIVLRETCEGAYVICDSCHLPTKFDYRTLDGEEHPKIKHEIWPRSDEK